MNDQIAVNDQTTSSDASDETFASFGLNPQLLRAVEEAGYKTPRPIQAQTVPQALEGNDILGLAQTGTGKTAAFALPLLQAASGERRSDAPCALVLAPTRELAQQTDKELRRLGRYLGCRTATIYGGVPQRKQVEALRRRPSILVACPGRLLDLLNQRLVDLRKIDMLVLDEADQMFDMGFLPSIQKILSVVPQDRQTMLFSATMPREIRKFADELLKDPVTVELPSTKPVATVEHVACPVMDGDKYSALVQVLARPDCASSIVFSKTKHQARRLAEKLEKQGHKAVALQGNMSQSQRDRAMEGFRKNRFEVLVATDIAARGIDVSRVSHVINYDLPSTGEGYTHRIGRTGRSEHSGYAFTFYTPQDKRALYAIERHLGSSIPRQTVEGEPLPAEQPRPRTYSSSGDSRAPQGGYARRRPRRRNQGHSRAQPGA